MVKQRIEIRRATLADLDLLAPLFDAYRQFYRKPTDADGARRFLAERLEHKQSIVFLAFSDAEALGFTQLYPSFSSASLARIFVLNDLFVVADGRRQGVGAALLKAAADYGRAEGAVRLVLATEITNTVAQSLYESLGWKRDTDFYAYQLAI